MFVLLGLGSYNFITPTVCTVIPLVTTVDVAYAYDGSPINALRTTSTRTAPGGSVDDLTGSGLGGAGIIAVYTLWEYTQGTQTLLGSSIGDALLSVYLSRPESTNGTAAEKNQLLNTLLVSFASTTERQAFTDFIFLQEGYLTAVIEISGSVSRKIILPVQTCVLMTDIDSSCRVLSGRLFS